MTSPDFSNRPKGWMVDLARRAMRGLTPAQRRRAISGDLSEAFEGRAPTRRDQPPD